MERPFRISGPQIMDGIVLTAFTIAHCVFRRRSARVASRILWATTGLAFGASVPVVLFDSSLPTAAIRAETLWATAILSLLAGLLASWLCVYLTANARSRIAFVVSVALLIASSAMYVRSCHLYFHPNDEFRLLGGDYRVGLRFRRGIGDFFSSGGQLAIFMPHSEPKPGFNYMRSGPGYMYWCGARLRFAGIGLAYLHSSKSEDDMIVSPLFAVLIPYWLMITASGLGAAIGVITIIRQTTAKNSPRELA